MNNPIVFFYKDTMYAVGRSNLVMLGILAIVVVGGLGLCVWYLLTRG